MNVSPISYSFVPMGSPSRGGDVEVYVFDMNQPSLPTPFYSVLVSVSVFMAISTVFHSINSPDNSLLSHSVHPVLFLPYWSFHKHTHTHTHIHANKWFLDNSAMGSLWDEMFHMCSLIWLQFDTHLSFVRCKTTASVFTSGTTTGSTKGPALPLTPVHWVSRHCLCWIQLILYSLQTLLSRVGLHR